MSKAISYAVMVIGVVAFLTPVAVTEQSGSLAPVKTSQQGEMPPRCGFVPPPLDLSHLTGREMPPRMGPLTPPERFDWRELGMVSPVKNQGLCGACYAFAALGNIESRLLIDGAGLFDFSENSAKECNFFQTSCDGGSYLDMAHWFSTAGTVLEACDPYVDSDVACNSSCPYIKTLLEWKIICTDNVPATSVLKSYIYTCGPLYTSLYAGDDNDVAWWGEFSAYDGSYALHYTGTQSNNHAVVIVGWDDTLSHAGGNGAWIVKNSWGGSWGGPCDYGVEGGYFYIAYGSATIGKWSSYIDHWQDYSSNASLHYYDEAGYTNSFGYGTATSWGMSKFTPTEEVYLNRVEFWTDDITTDVDVYVYDNYDGSTPSGLLGSSLNHSFEEAGYHSVSLPDPPTVAIGEDVYVVLKVTNGGYTYPLVVDCIGPSETGMTYASGNGLSGSWSDLGIYYGCDASIRIRTTPTLVLAVDDHSSLLPRHDRLLHNYPNPFNPATTIVYRLHESEHVQLFIFNLLGQRIATLVDGVEAAGTHEVRWDGTDENGVAATTGVYFYQIIAGSYSETRKMVLLK